MSERVCGMVCIGGGLLGLMFASEVTRPWPLAVGSFLVLALGMLLTVFGSSDG